MIEWPSGNVHMSYCGLMFVFLMPGVFFSPAMSISLSKWPMLPTIALSFICAMCSAVMMSCVAGRGDEDVGGADDVFEREDLVALHRRLQRADRVDLGDDHAGALALAATAAQPLPTSP